MAKIKLVVSATIGETFSDFIISKRQRDLPKRLCKVIKPSFKPWRGTWM